jgi:hypothetical protein
MKKPVDLTIVGCIIKKKNATEQNKVVPLEVMFKKKS